MMHQPIDPDDGLHPADVRLLVKELAERLPKLEERLVALDKASKPDWTCRCPDFCLLHTQFTAALS